MGRTKKKTTGKIFYWFISDRRLVGPGGACKRQKKKSNVKKKMLPLLVGDFQVTQCIFSPEERSQFPTEEVECVTFNPEMRHPLLDWECNWCSSNDSPPWSIKLFWVLWWQYNDSVCRRQLTSTSYWNINWMKFFLSYCITARIVYSCFNCLTCFSTFFHRNHTARRGSHL